MTRRIRQTRTLVTGALFVVGLVMLAPTSRTGNAQITSDILTAWDMPLFRLSGNSILHVSGTHYCVHRTGACLPPQISAALRIANSTTFFDITNVALSTTANKKVPGVFMFTGDILVETLNQLAPGELGAGGVTLHVRVSVPDTTSRPRHQLTAGVYVEETSAVGNPLFQSYATWLAEPRPDPVFQLLFQ